MLITQLTLKLNQATVANGNAYAEYNKILVLKNSLETTDTNYPKAGDLESSKIAYAMTI